MAIFVQGEVVFGRYTIDEFLSKDGTDERYRASHRELGHQVQLRCFVGSADSASLARFERAAQMMARVRHGHVVSLLDYGVAKDRPIAVLEAVSGRTVRDILDASGAMSWRLAVGLGCSLLDAVGAVHCASVLHRNIRPVSVFVIEDDAMGVPQVLLSDLGLAKPRWQDDANITAAGMVVGSPIYMSPEQLDLMETDARSDLYAVALLLFECMTGDIPEKSRSRMALARRLVSEPRAPQAPKELPPIPQSVKRVLVQALARDPSERFQSAGEFLAELRGAAEESQVLGAEESPAVPAWRTSKVPPRQTRVLRLQPTSPASAPRQNQSIRASGWQASNRGEPVRALVAIRVQPDADRLVRSQVELFLQQHGDSYRVSETAWIGAVRANSASGASTKTQELSSALRTAVGERGAVLVQCGTDPIDVPTATLEGLAPPTVEMMALLDKVSAQLSRGATRTAEL